MAQGSGFTSRGPLSIPLTPVPRAPTIRSGAAGARKVAGIYDDLARGTGRIGADLLEQERERIAEEEAAAGEAAGVEAARSGEAFTPRESGFVDSLLGADDASYNDAATVGYYQGLKVRIKDRANDLALEFPADPDSAAKALEQERTTTLKNVPQNLHADVNLLFDEYGNGLDSVLAKQKKDRSDEEAAFNAKTLIDSTTRDIKNAAYDSGNPFAAAESLAELEADLRDGVGGGIYTAEYATRVLVGATADAHVSAHMGNWDRAPSREALDAFIALDTPELDPEVKRRMVNSMQTDLNQQAAAADAANKRLGKRVKSYVETKEKGLLVDPDAEADLVERTRGTEYEHAVDLAGRTSSVSREVNKWAPQQQQAEIEALDLYIEKLKSTPIPEAATDEALAELESAEALRDQIATSMEETQKSIDDGLYIDRANDIGLLDTAPLDSTSPEALEATLAERIEDAEHVEALWNIPPGNIFTERETNDLVAFLQPGAAETEAQADTIIGLSNRLGQDRFGALVEHVAEKDPALAYVAGMPRQLVVEAINGRSILLANPSLVPGAGTEAMRGVVSDTLGPPLAGSPNTIEDITEAARWIYAERSAKEGDLSGELVDERMAQALTDAAGGIVEWSNDSGVVLSDTSTVILPGRFAELPDDGRTDERRFEDLMDSLDYRDLSAAGNPPVTTAGLPLSADSLRRMAVLRTIGDGRYSVIMQGEQVRSRNGDPYELDLTAVLRARRERGEVEIPKPPPIVVRRLEKSGIIPGSRDVARPVVIEPAPAPTERAPEPAPVPESTFHLGTGEVTRPTETVILGTGERVPGEGGSDAPVVSEGNSSRPTTKAQGPAGADGDARGKVKPKEVGDISKMSRKELLALNMRELTEEQLAQVVERDLELQGR